MAKKTPKTRTFKPNDRVTVSDGPGFTLGYGTVMAFYPAKDATEIDLVEVSLDDDEGLNFRLFPISRIKDAK